MRRVGLPTVDMYYGRKTSTRPQAVSFSFSITNFNGDRGHHDHEGLAQPPDLSDLLPDLTLASAIPTPCHCIQQTINPILLPSIGLQKYFCISEFHPPVTRPL